MMRFRDVAGPLWRAGFMAAGLCFAAFGVSAQVNDGHGKEWLQLPSTVGLSWNQIAAVCPRDGATRCEGAAAGRDLSEWTWATDAQTLELMSYYEPAMATNRSVSGFQYFFTGQTFLTAFQPTFSSCQTYQCSAYGAGWTATKDDEGNPIFGWVSWGTTPVSIGGSFGVGPTANADETSGLRGAWLWRDPNGIFAVNDYGQVNTPAGGTAVANVLANDRIAGQPANFANVSITQLSSSNANVTLNVFDGSVNVANPTPAGTYTLVYRMCSLANTTFCDNATVTVVVNPYRVDAVDDSAIGYPSTGGTAIANVLANDTANGGAATFASVELSQVSVTPNNGGVTLNTSTGAVSVTRGAPLGTYAVVYRICARGDLTVCDTATATVVLRNYSIDAVDDYVRASSKIGSSPINILTNDTFNGLRASTAYVQITQLSPPTNGITINTATGLVTIANKVQSGIYNFNYRICEIAAPANCDSAVLTVELSGR